MITRSLEETSALAVRLASGWRPVPPRLGGEAGRRERAFVVGLYGDLGSGKTTFVQAVARALGVDETVNSPTFVIEKVYELPPDNALRHLIHIDCYRLSGPDELTALGFQSLITNPYNLVLIEWADRVVSLLPADHTKIYFKMIDETSREISYEKR